MGVHSNFCIICAGPYMVDYYSENFGSNTMFAWGNYAKHLNKENDTNDDNQQYNWLELTFCITQDNIIMPSGIIHDGNIEHGKCDNVVCDEFDICDGPLHSLSTFPFMWDDDSTKTITCHRSCYNLLSTKLDYKLKFTDMEKLINDYGWLDEKLYGPMNKYSMDQFFDPKCFTKDSWLVEDPMSNERNSKRILDMWKLVIEEHKLD